MNDRIQINSNLLLSLSNVNLTNRRDFILTHSYAYEYRCVDMSSACCMINEEMNIASNTLYKNNEYDD